ncbi:MAG: metallophosphatase family protein [Verrucomicrobia bacterium]|nr:metallophosphatase family protein [Verrucomicrobiota bacterium]
MRIGILSDTHNYLDPAIEGLFKGVDHILHAGDVGMPWILLQLEQIAPVTAVMGNTDVGMQLRDTEAPTLDQRIFLVQHIVNPLAPAETLRKRIANVRPAAVVFGHTHQVFEQTIGGILFINPGYAGRPKFSQPRTVAVLHTDARRMCLEVLPLR